MRAWLGQPRPGRDLLLIFGFHEIGRGLRDHVIPPAYRNALEKTVPRVGLFRDEGVRGFRTLPFHDDQHCRGHSIGTKKWTALDNRSLHFPEERVVFQPELFGLGKCAGRKVQRMVWSISFY